VVHVELQRKQQHTSMPIHTASTSRTGPHANGTQLQLS
jgi:hypothetical protein